MHDCYFTIKNISRYNASIKWWQFWRKPREQIAPCHRCRWNYLYEAERRRYQ